MNRRHHPSLMHELSSYVAGALRRKLPDAVAERAKVHLVDTIAAMVSGTHLVPGKRAIAFVRMLGGRREAGVIGTRIVTSSMHAALANGMCGHADETDDTHPPSRSHPGTIVIPAALAIAERQRLDGRTALRAVVLGYDIGTRILIALGHTQMREAGRNGTALGGLFGAAAAAGALLGLTAHQVPYLLSYCAQQAAGLTTTLREEEHIEKASTHCGIPAHNGVMLALMVKSGFTGVEDVFSGDPNFLDIFSPDPDRAIVVQGLGRDYEIMRAGIKYWPAGAPIQGALHVLYDLIRQHGIGANDVEKIVARIPEKDMKTVSDRAMTDISLQHLLAVMLVDGNLTFRTAHDEKRVRDSEVRKVRSRIEAVGDPALTDLLRRWRCIMEITLKNGRTLTHQTMAAKGVSDNPLTRADVAAKALDLMAPVLGRKRSENLMAKLFEIDRIDDVRTLRRLYSA